MGLIVITTLFFPDPTGKYQSKDGNCRGREWAYTRRKYPAAKSRGYDQYSYPTITITTTTTTSTTTTTTTTATTTTTTTTTYAYICQKTTNLSN